MAASKHTCTVRLVAGSASHKSSRMWRSRLDRDHLAAPIRQSLHTEKSESLPVGLPAAGLPVGPPCVRQVSRTCGHQMGFERAAKLQAGSRQGSETPAAPWRGGGVIKLSLGDSTSRFWDFCAFRPQQPWQPWRQALQVRFPQGAVARPARSAGTVRSPPILPLTRGEPVSTGNLRPSTPKSSSQNPSIWMAPATPCLSHGCSALPLTCLQPALG